MVIIVPPSPAPSPTLGTGIFPALKAAILRCTGVSVTEVYASTDTVAMEMADLANEVASDIAKSHDWRILTKVHTITGDGGLTYPLPDDYDRMVLASEIDEQSNWLWGYYPFADVNEWMRCSSGNHSIINPGGWIDLGGYLNFYPAPTGTAEFPYIRNDWARDSGGNSQTAFTSDEDTFILDNRLLTLGLIWRWLAQKKMDYSEEMATYELALSQAQTRDKGARVLRSGRGKTLNGKTAYSMGPLG